MKLVLAVKNWWSNSSLVTKLVSGAGILVTVAVVVSVVVSAGGQTQVKEPVAKAQVLMSTQSATPSATASVTPTPSESPSAEETTTPQTKSAPQVNAAPAAPVAPSFEAFTATASDYGIAQTLNNLTGSFPTGILTAAQALPAAQGTGPITYSIANLPTGAGFDANTRKIFIDTASFIPAYQQDFPDPNCPTTIRQRVSVTFTVQYIATGPGGQTAASVPLNFGVVTAPAGMFHFGC